MDTVYPATASALARGRRLRSAGLRERHRTTPVTFAEIKEVDEETSEVEECEERCGAKRRPDVLEERLGRQFAEFRRRRDRRRDVLRERDHESPPPSPSPRPPSPAGITGLTGMSRAGSEPSALHHGAT